MRACAHAHAHVCIFNITRFSADAQKPVVSRPGRRIQTRRSGVHGKGVFAVQDIAEGETLIEYVGEVITWKEAQRRHPHDPEDPNHTFYFHIDEEHVIDAKFGGNSSRWINHSCDPNCEADEEDGRVFIKALRNIAAGRRAELRLRPDHRRALHAQAQGRVPVLVRREELPRHAAGAQAQAQEEQRRAAKMRSAWEAVQHSSGQREAIWAGGRSRRCRASRSKCCPRSTPPTPS